MIDRFLTMKEVCKILNCCSDTVDKLHRIGLLPRIQITRKVIRYKESDLAKLIERRLLD